MSEPVTAGPVEDPTAQPTTGSPHVGPLVVGVVLIGFGLLILFQARAIPGEGWSPSGPRFLPLVLAVAWIGLSVVYLAQQVTAFTRRRPMHGHEPGARIGAVAVLVAVLVVYAYLLEPIGYLFATALFFLAGARVLGSHSIRRDALIAVLLTLAVYFAFTRALGIHLPDGGMVL
ncbi:MAG: tripartite tricarboxylate transporter TctB family protein [Propionibacteriales bacterium]|nr:tripartite tricarboxylate transporter TctB family protein [Propionibacteriales bacterium]